MKFLVQRPKSFAVLAMLLGLECLRHLIFLSIGPLPIVMDAAEYWQSGLAVAQGDYFQKTVNTPYRTPIYPYYLSVPQILCGDRALLVAVLGQHLMVFATTIITCMLAAALSGRRIAALFCYVLMLPLLARLWYANVILTESLFTLPFTAGMGMLLLYEHRPTARTAVIAGLLLGIATMIRPVPQLLIPALAVLLVLTGTWKLRPWKARQSFPHAVLLLGCFGLMLAPCFARNMILHDEFFLTKLPAMNKWAVAFRDGSGGDLPWPRTQSAERMEEQLNVPPGVLNDRHAALVRSQLIESGLSIEETEELMSRVSWDAIQANPGQFFWRAFKRIVNYWRCVTGSPPFGGQMPPDFQGQQVWRIPGLSAIGEFASTHMPSHSLWWNQVFSLIAWVAAMRLLFSREHRWKGIVLVSTFSYFCLLTGLVEIENFRYRMILEPLMVLGVVLAFTPSAQSESREDHSSPDRPPETSVLIRKQDPQISPKRKRGN